MIEKVSKIVDGNFMKVDILVGIRRVHDIFYEKNTECFIAYDNEKLMGVITKKELIGAHPNRIIADVMYDKYICINHCSHIWKAKEIFDFNTDLEIILVEDENEIIGYITRSIVNTEFGKHIDPLTGLYKRDYLLYMAYKLISNKQNATIIFMDLDNFGYIDKKHGHLNGDTILKHVAELLNKNISSDSYLCRYGGDEFAIVTPYCLDSSKDLAEKILNEIQSYQFPNNIRVSASIGLVGYNEYNTKEYNVWKLTNNLVNMASLASSKAKHSINSLIIEHVDVDSIA